MKIHVNREGRAAGPYDPAEVLRMLGDGQLRGDDLGWSEGMEDWQPLHSIPDLTASPAVPPLSPYAPPAFHDPVAISPGSTGPKGVGGWLLFFCISLTILGPVFSVLQMFGGWAQAKPAFEIYPSIRTAILVENSCGVLLLVFGAVTGIRIWSGNPHGPSLARRFLAVNLGGFVAMEAAALFVMRDVPEEIFDHGVQGTLSTCLRVLIHATVWWSYFKMSKRVRNTYGEA